MFLAVLRGAEYEHLDTLPDHRGGVAFATAVGMRAAAATRELRERVEQAELALTTARQAIAALETEFGRTLGVHNEYVAAKETELATLHAQHRAAVALIDYIKPALPVLKTMLTVAGLQAGADKAAEMIAAIDALTPTSPDTAPVDHTRTIVRDLGTELASQVTRARRLQAAITQARAELLANQPWNERIDAALEVLDGALVLPTVDTAPVGEA
jgi:hypothetical protein